MRPIWHLLVVGFITDSLALPANADSRPIPQNSGAQEQRRRDALSWNRRTLGDAYERVGRKDPRWDRHAREALDAAARMFSKVLEPHTDWLDVHNEVVQAIGAGCDDPMILYLYARSSYDAYDPGPEEFERRYLAAAAAMERSAYPPSRVCVALYKAGQIKSGKKGASAGDRSEAERLLHAALDALARSAAEEERNLQLDDIWYEAATTAVGAFGSLTGDPLTGWRHVDARLAKSPALNTVRLKAKGNFYTGYAWKARGTGVAKEVSEDGWKKFGVRLAVARKALEEAWVLKPGDAKTAERMLWVLLGQSAPRPETEKWFRRAMTADGENLKACEVMLEWLDPKWHGSREEMVAFGRACRDTDNWRSGITLLVAEAHFRAGRGLSNAAWQEHFRSDEVWRDIATVYTEYLKNFPGDAQARTKFAVFCCWCGRYDASQRQFLLLGDKRWSGGDFTEAVIKDARDAAARGAGQQPLAGQAVAKSTGQPKGRPREASEITAPAAASTGPVTKSDPYFRLGQWLGYGFFGAILLAFVARAFRGASSPH